MLDCQHPNSHQPPLINTVRSLLCHRIKFLNAWKWKYIHTSSCVCLHNMMALEISMNVLGIRWHGSASCLGSVNSSWILLPLVGSCNEQFIIDTDEINTTAQWHSMNHLINYLIHHPAPTISLPARARVWAAVWHNGVVRKSCSNKHKYLCNLNATP